MVGLDVKAHPRPGSSFFSEDRSLVNAHLQSRRARLLSPQKTCTCPSTGGAAAHPLQEVRLSAHCAKGGWCSVSKLAVLWKHMGRTRCRCFPPRPDMGAVFQERGKASGTYFPGDCVHLLEGQPGEHESPLGGSPSLMWTFGGHTHGPQLCYLLVSLPEAQVRYGSAPSPLGPAKPHFHFLSKVGLSLL